MQINWVWGSSPNLSSSEIKQTESRNAEVIAQALAQEVVARLFKGGLVHVALIGFELRVDFGGDGFQLSSRDNAAN